MRRFWVLLGGYTAIAAILAPACIHPAPRLVWNASESVPVGLYLTHPAHHAVRGDLVAALPPQPMARLMADRRYLPLGMPMLKHVAGTAGQRVCRIQNAVSIDGAVTAFARRFDRSGRVLPVWQGCRTLRATEVFLLNSGSADSFDGRYFGPVAARSIIATLTPLWLPGSTGEHATSAVPASTKGPLK